MRTVRFYRSLKPRVRKKYTLICGIYISPKELKSWYKNWTKKHKAYHKDYFETLLKER